VQHQTARIHLDEIDTKVSCGTIFISWYEEDLYLRRPMTRNGGNRIAELINLIAILMSLLPPGTIIQPKPDGNLEALYIWLQDLQKMAASIDTTVVALRNILTVPGEVDNRKSRRAKGNSWQASYRDFHTMLFLQFDHISPNNVIDNATPPTHCVTIEEMLNLECSRVRNERGN
jgi:hypothetical protein